MNSLYFTADMLDLQLICRGDQATGFDERDVWVGPFCHKMKVLAVTDIIRPMEVGTFVCIGGKVWLYVVVTEQRHTVYWVDGEKAELTIDNLQKYGGISWANTISKFVAKHALLGVFQWDGLQYNKVESKKKES